MRTRAHMGVMLAAAAAVLGASRLPALNIPSLSAGGASSKGGKHRRSGTVRSRGISMGYSRGTNRTNAERRKLKAVQRGMRGVPGGWKRVFRNLRINARAKGVDWPQL